MRCVLSYPGVMEHAEQIALALSNLKLRETLRQQSVRDPLTGLYNRRALLDHLDARLAPGREGPVAALFFDLDRLMGKTGAPAFVGDRESVEGAEPFTHGRSWSIGSLKIESRLTWGHSKGGITYVVGGLIDTVVQNSVATAKILLFSTHLLTGWLFYAYLRRLNFGALAPFLREAGEKQKRWQDAFWKKKTA